MTAAGPHRGHHVPIDKQSPGRRKTCREKWTMSQDNGTPATRKNSVPQCRLKTTQLLQELQERTEREPGNLTEPRGQERGIP